jgi:hypothetical protein
MMVTGMRGDEAEAAEAAVTASGSEVQHG